jgi:hypothetical protein
MDVQAQMDKIFKGAEDGKPKMDVQTDGPMGVGILSQDALKNYRPTITDSPLKGIIFDLATLLNVTPKDSGDDAMEGNIISDSHWNIGRGARETLMYINARGIKTALLPRIFIDNKLLVDGTVDVFEDRLNYRFKYHAENTSQLKHVSGNLNSISLEMGLDKKSIMCVSMSEHVIREAKKQNMFTCAMSLGSKNWKTSQAALNKIVKMDELKSHVEELNGITYRI